MSEGQALNADLRWARSLDDGGCNVDNSALGAMFTLQHWWARGGPGLSAWAATQVFQHQWYRRLSGEFGADQRFQKSELSIIRWRFGNLRRDG